MQRYNNTILARGTGLALQDALVTIYETGTADKVAIYSENDTASDELANPLTTDSFGMIDGYIPDGVYDLRIDHGSYPSYTVEEVQIFDLSELAASELSQYATVTGTANQIAYFGGDNIVVTTDFTQAARNLMDDTSTAEMRETLGLSFRGAVVNLQSDMLAADFSGVPGSTVTLSWDEVLYDTSDFFDLAGDTSRLTIPDEISWVRLRAQVRLDNLTSGEWFYLAIFKNGAFTMGLPNHTTAISAPNPVINLASAAIPVLPGDYFTCVIAVEADNSVTLSSADSFFGIELVE